MRQSNRLHGRIGVRLFRLRSDRGGVVAAEFALLLPLLTLLLCTTFQYGMLLFSYNVMLVSARNSTRSLADETATVAEAKALALANLPQWVPAEKWTVTPEDPAPAGAGIVATRITIESKYATILPLAPMPTTMDAYVVMQKAS